jgi:serine protease inhibitor ecotin
MHTPGEEQKAKRRGGLNPTATLVEHTLLAQRFTGGKTPLPFVVYAQQAVILRGQIWSAHESDVVGLVLKNY